MISNSSPKLIFEEKKANKLFFWVFYCLYFAYDIIYFYIKAINQKADPVNFKIDGLGLLQYILIISLLPISLYLGKRKNPFITKYVLLYGFIIIDIIFNLLKYYGSSETFASGNIVELLFILFSPIFVNKKYFWAATIGLIGKYLLLGIILQAFSVAVPILGFIALAALAYLLLLRVTSYISSLTIMYNEAHQKEKLVIVGQMATAIGHEIRNPLAALKGFTQLQQEMYPNTNEFYPIMIQEIDRINSIVTDLMYLGKPKAIKFEKVYIDEIVSYTIAIIEQQAHQQGIQFETMIENEIPEIDCGSNQLKQVLLNLTKNAIESMPDGGTIRVFVKTNEDQVNISIQDEGCGIPAEKITSIGEPFYTTKTEGTGLGLMVTNQIIKDHNGKINIESVEGNGTTVNISLPISQVEFSIN